MKTYLLIDSGNTRLKAAKADASGIYQVFSGSESEFIASLEVLGNFDAAMICSVKSDDSTIIHAIQAKMPLHVLSHQSNLPFELQYAQPEKLGKDRLALVSAVATLQAGKPCLVIDAGTCVTYDIIDANKQYRGGNISPGLQLRLRAMHVGTGKLPDVTFKLTETIPGTSTETCMQTAAFWGLVFEIDGFIQTYQQQFPGLATYICGGDAAILAKRLKMPIFAEPDLLFNGLYQLATKNLE